MASIPAPATVAAALAQTVQQHPKTAYIDKDRDISWQEVDATSSRLARRLRALGLGKGDRIGIILPNRIEWIYTYFAAAKIGAVVVGLNVRYRDVELDFMLADSQIKAVLAPRSYAGFDYVQFLTQAQTRFPALQHLLFVDDASPQNLLGGRGVVFHTLLAPGADETAALPAEYSPQPDDLLLIIYTSGTTGRPKAAGITHRSQLASARAQVAHTKFTADDLLQLALPLNHVGGTTCGVLSMLLAGGTCELMPEFNTDTLLEMSRKHPPTLLTGVPTMLTLLLMHPQLSRGDFSRLRLLIVGGSNVDATLLTRLQAAFPGVAIMNLYGLSESSGAIVMTPWGASQQALLETIGKPLAGAQVRVVSREGQDLPAGEVGELWFRGLGVIRAYVGSQRDEGAFDAEGWLHTGDLGFVDEAGLIHLMGRQKDMYIQGGFNVYPAEIESVIASHPEVLMVAGIGVPDPVLGEVGRCYVVRKPGSMLSAQALQDFCRVRLADYKVPRQIVFREQLPLTPAGKIQKAALRTEDSA